MFVYQRVNPFVPKVSHVHHLSKGMEIPFKEDMSSTSTQDGLTVFSQISFSSSVMGYTFEPIEIYPLVI